MTGFRKLTRRRRLYAYTSESDDDTDLSLMRSRFGLARTYRAIHGEMREIMKSSDLKRFKRTSSNSCAPVSNSTYSNDDDGKRAILREATSNHSRDGRPFGTKCFAETKSGNGSSRSFEAFREQSAGESLLFETRSRRLFDPVITIAQSLTIWRDATLPMKALGLSRRSIPGPPHADSPLPKNWKGVPNFRKFGGYTAYSEGWGYFGYLPKDEVFYEGSLF